MTIKEIEKLREKVEKDPNSKMYVPLAEEYRKEGMLEQAVEVLQKGLEKQPGYMSARVLLGKIYLERGQMDEARDEFENVVKLIPDNLYAHKKLAEIYRDTGKKDLAIESFRTFLKLNPMDEDALKNLQELEGTYTEPPAEEQEHIAQLSDKAAAKEEIPFEAMSLEQTAHERVQVEAEESGEEIDAFKESLFGFKGEAGDESTEEPLALEEEIKDEASEEETAEQWSFAEGENDRSPAAGEGAGIETAEEDSIEIEEAVEEDGEGLSFGDMDEVLKNDGVEGLEGADNTVYEVDYAEASSGADSIIPADNSGMWESADRFISEGNYLGAIGLYRRILAATPEDKKTFQRIEELRSLLKLMGKDKEVLISKLNAFQSAIKKRGDEFFGRS